MKATFPIVLGAAALALLAPSTSVGQARTGVWKVWGTFGSDEDVLMPAVAFAPQTMTLAAGQENGKVRLWHAGNGRDGPLFEAKEIKSILALHFDAAGNRLVAAGEMGVRGWDVPAGKKVAQFAWKAGPANLAVFSRDGQTLTGALAAGQVEVWKVADGTLHAQLPMSGKGFVSSLALSPDGSLLAIGTSEGAVELWQEGKLLATLQKPDAGLVRGLAFSASGEQLASVRGRESVMLWHVETRKLIKQMPADLPPYYALAFSPRGDAIAAGGANGTVHLWSVPGGRKLATLKGHAGAVVALAFSPTGRMLASSCTDTTIKVWDAHRTLKLPQTKCAAAELVRLFKDLRSDNEIKGSRAVLALLASSDQALPVLKTLLPQGQKPNIALVDKFIGELADIRFKVRDNARKELAAMGQSIRPELQRWLKKKLDLEAQLRVEQLLARLLEEKLQPDQRILTKRAVVLLERVGTPEAIGILEGLLYGMPVDEIIADARAALARMQ
jgi:WD40 repeat protein